MVQHLFYSLRRDRTHTRIVRTTFVMVGTVRFLGSPPRQLSAWCRLRSAGIRQAIKLNVTAIKCLPSDLMMLWIVKGSVFQISQLTLSIQCTDFK